MKCVLALAFFSLMIPALAAAQEKVVFPSTDADLKGGTPTTITGYLYKPAGSGPFAAVVGMHGGDGLFKKGKINPLHGQWGQILSDKGYLVLLVDSFQPRGQGEEVDYSNLNILPEREMPRDAFGAMNYLRSRADVRPDSIVVMGQSYGGAATLFTIANGALPKDVRDFRAAIAFYPGCIRIKDAHWRPRVPMLLLMGDLDDVGSLTACKELIAHTEGGASIDAHFYPDAHHAFDLQNVPVTVTSFKSLKFTTGSNPEARADAINRVTQFLAKELQ